MWYTYSCIQMYVFKPPVSICAVQVNEIHEAFEAVTVGSIGMRALRTDAATLERCLEMCIKRKKDLVQAGVFLQIGTNGIVGCVVDVTGFIAQSETKNPCVHFRLRGCCDLLTLQKVHIAL